MQEVLSTLRVPYQGQELDFEAPFRRATMHDLVREATGERGQWAMYAEGGNLNWRLGKVGCASRPSTRSTVIDPF